MEIKIYDDIDTYYGYNLAQLEYDLAQAKGEDVHVKIQSGGGSVFEGLAIYNTLKNYEGNVTTEIVGISASIASVIFLAGSKRIVNDVGFLMIHEAWTITAGGADELREDADLLDKINSQILDIYVNVTGLNREDLAERMSKDTYMGPDELKELGFVTEIKEGARLVASIQNFTNKQLKKEPSMAMTKEEKAHLESVEAQNEDFKNSLAEKDKEIEALKADVETVKAGVEDQIKNAIQAEKERESEILASVLDEKQLDFAKECVAKGMGVQEAKLSIMDNFKANKGEFMKVDAGSLIDSQAPKASSAEGGEQMSVTERWKAIKDPKQYQKFFQENKAQIEKERK